MQPKKGKAAKKDNSSGSSSSSSSSTSQETDEQDKEGMPEGEVAQKSQAKPSGDQSDDSSSGSDSEDKVAEEQVGQESQEAEGTKAVDTSGAAAGAEGENASSSSSSSSSSSAEPAVDEAAATAAPTATAEAAGGTAALAALVPATMPVAADAESVVEDAKAEVEAFLALNPVDPEAALRLRKLSASIQRKVIERGDLQQARNASAMLIARMRDAESGALSQDGLGAPAPPPTGASHAGVEALISQYGLDASVAAKLRALPVGKQDLAAGLDLSGARNPSAFVMAQLTQGKFTEGQAVLPPLAIETVA